ncbi:hypothetical protein E4T50_13702 [Aureobasidium sp. EXF-12298]|nr:hypothetical protein E4T50_13702 [Aureobasidium sp. EXF-12298]
MLITQILISLHLLVVTYAQMTNNRNQDWITEQIKQQKLSPICFSGRHNKLDSQTLTTQEILDFDFQAECSGFIDLNMLEIKSSDIVDKITMIIGGNDEKAGEEELVQQAIEKLQSIATFGDRYSITFDNVFINHDGMDASFQRWANLARYGGRTTFTLDNISNSLRPESRTNATSNKPHISIKAIWKYKYNAPKPRSTTRYVLPTTPNLHPGPRPMTWDLRIQHAIVDGEKGVISLEDDISRVSPTVKAIAKYALHETLTRQGNFGTSRIRKWGLDEPNDKVAYVGARHLGGAMRIELPPPYSE